MKVTLNKTATAIFKSITQLCEATEDNHIKIDNNSSFMPLCVELLHDSADGKVFSFSHYYEQNGDLVPDPDMTFLQLKNNPDAVIPCTFQNSIYYEEACLLKGGKWMANKKKASDLAIFANVWMKNIHEQQLKNERKAA